MRLLVLVDLASPSHQMAAGISPWYHRGPRRISDQYHTSIMKISREKCTLSSTGAPKHFVSSIRIPHLERVASLSCRRGSAPPHLPHCVFFLIACICFSRRAIRRRERAAMAMIGRAIGCGAASALLRRGGLEWTRSYGSNGGDASTVEPLSPTPQHFGVGKLIGKTALITGL